VVLWLDRRISTHRELCFVLRGVHFLHTLGPKKTEYEAHVRTVRVKFEHQQSFNQTCRSATEWAHTYFLRLDLALRTVEKDVQAYPRAE